MPYFDDGQYYTLFPAPGNLLKVEFTITMLCWEALVFAALLGLLVYLTFFNTKIPTVTLRKLQITGILSICTMAALLCQFIDGAPPFLFWLFQWGSFVLNLLLMLLALELFKTFSVLGSHFTVLSISRAQRFWIAWYVLCALGHNISIITIGKKTYPWALIVNLSNLVEKRCDRIVSWIHYNCRCCNECVHLEISH